MTGNESESDDSRWKRILEEKDMEGIYDLVCRYHEPIVSYLVSRRCSNPEDITQEMWLRAIKKADEFKPEKASILTWLRTIAKRIAVSGHRKEQTEKKALRRLAQKCELVESPGATDTSDDVSDEFLLVLKEATNQPFSPNERKVVDWLLSDQGNYHAYRGGEISSRKIGEKLGMNPATFRKSLERVIPKIIAYMRDNWFLKKDKN